MIIILEGPDGAGKSTLSKRIQETYVGHTVIPMRGVYPMDESFIDNSFHFKDVIWDRHFVSENIYSDFYKKDRRLDATAVKRYVEYCKENDIPILILLPKDRPYGVLESEDEDIKERHSDLVQGYEDFCQQHGINPIETQEQANNIVKIIEKGLWKKEEEK